MASIRGKVTTAPALVEGVIDATNAKRNDSIAALQVKMETTSQWLDEAINSAKRKINEGSEHSIHDVKKPKTTTFAKETSFKQKESNLSPIRSVDKENSPNVKEHPDKQHVRVKPPPSAVKRKVDGMRVVDLRKELKEKGKETKGLKKDLQQRLLQAYTTVEKIMSPQKPEQPPERHDEPPTKELEDNFSDSDSMEMVVFESAKNDGGDGGEETNERQEESEENDVSEGADAEMGETNEDKSSLQSATANEVDKAAFTNDSMEIGVSEQKSQERNEANNDNDNVNESGTEEKRLSIMDCTDMEESVSPNKSKEKLFTRNAGNAPQGKTSAPKITLSVDPPNVQAEQEASRSKTQSDAPVESNKGASSKQLSDGSRKVSQESMSGLSVESMHSAKFSATSGSKQGLKSSRTDVGKQVIQQKPRNEGHQASHDSKLPQQVEKTSTSPIKRVKDAIQMFTAKSPPKLKSTTATSKLAWLNKSKFQILKSNSSLEGEKSASEDPVMETPSEKTEVMTTGKAMRRPGMGLYNNKATSSALKSSSKYLTAQPSSTLSANAKATNDARKARLAEIRGKSKASNPAALKTKTFTAAKDNTCASASQKPMSSAASESKETKRKLLTAQMREKAAARKQKGAISADKPSVVAAPDVKTLEAAAKMSTVNADTNKLKTCASNASTSVKNDTTTTIGNEEGPVSYESTEKLVEAPTVERVVPMSTQKVAEKSIEVSKLPMSTQKVVETTAEESLVPMSAKKSAETPAREAQPEVETGVTQPPALSPLDTYEISDREDSESESESESESDDERNSRKKIPDWAQRGNLLPALEKQFAQGAGRIDPDEIFPEVQTCDLQAIFSSKRSRYIRRTSSANWSRDKVTPCEQLAYKRAMGFSKKK